jgi:16S rRNA (guanine966-N2)-methyltransferase
MHTAHKVRIIGGQWKRTPIPVVDAPGLRPTPDRVRETLFNWLDHLRPGAAALRGLDLFAGSGALGFELASRGAQRVLLVETQRAALAALHALKEKLDARTVEIMAGEALAIAAQLPAAGFDLVFIDPPFDGGRLWPAVAACRRLLAPGGLIYVESGAEIAPETAATHGMQHVRNGRAGQVRFCLLAPVDD